MILVLLDVATNRLTRIKAADWHSWIINYSDNQTEGVDLDACEHV